MWPGKMTSGELDFTVGSHPDEDDLIADLFRDRIGWGEIRRRGDAYELRLTPAPDGTNLPADEAIDLLVRALARLRQLER
jgi:hypothetical protein